MDGLAVGHLQRHPRLVAPAHHRALTDLRARELLDGDTLTMYGVEVRQQIEERTDALEQPLLDAIGADLEHVLDQLNEWGRQVIEAGDFPPDPRKRAAG